MKPNVLSKRIGMMVVGIALLAASPSGTYAAIILNELTVQGLERIEIYNSGPIPVSLDGFSFVSGTDTIPLPDTTITPGTYFLFETGGDIILDIGEEGLIVDATKETVDGVFFGQVGGAPLPPASAPFSDGPGIVTLARAPDASSFSTPPPSDPITDGDRWTLDLTPTFGTTNDAPDPDLGASLLVNEVDPKPVGGGDMVELFNPTGTPIDIGSWFLCNGVAFQFLASAIVPPGGLVALTTDPGFDIEAVDLLYVFDADSVRVDQLGFNEPAFAPPLDECQCFAKFPDGDGPRVCYDFPTCGGGETLRALVCTPGKPNEDIVDCNPTATEPARWGRLKHRFGE